MNAANLSRVDTVTSSGRATAACDQCNHCAVSQSQQAASTNSSGGLIGALFMMRISSCGKLNESRRRHGQPACRGRRNETGQALPDPMKGLRCSAGQIDVSTSCRNQPNPGIADARAEDLCRSYNRAGAGRFACNGIFGNRCVHSAKKLRTRVGRVHLRRILAGEFRRDDGCLQSAALASSTIGNTNHYSQAVMNDKSAILVFRISGCSKKNRFHQI